MKNKSVITYAGGGGSRSTGKTRALDPNVILNRERSERASGSDQCDRKNELSSRGANERERRGDPISQCSILKWIATPAKPARNDAGGRAGLLLGWSLKSHVQPLWMALSAFTMAEILLSLTIIGVVAAITLPSLTGNINERTWNTQRKALYARFSQAMALMPSLNGYGTFSAEQTDSSGSITQSAVDTTTETFITDGLAKVMKINNICDNEHLEDCGIPSTISPGNGASAVNISDITSLRGFNSLFAASAAKVPLDTKAAAFETQNGESIIVYYNPNCTPDMSGNSGNYYPHAEMCANFVYDLNGNKGPNTVGKDIGFITAFYPTDPIIVSPMPLATDATWASQIDASKSCQKQDTESRLPNLNELASMMYNRKLLGITTGDYWSSSSVSASQGWIQNFSLGNRYLHPRGNSLAVRCVKR